MQDVNISFIGGGNMATSLIGGLIADGFSAKHITVSEPSAEKRAQLAAQFGVQIVAENDKAVMNADVVVLATKPQVLGNVARGLHSTLLERKPLIVSIAAGVRVQSLQEWLGSHCAIVRCMPNTPALVRSGATGLFANAQVTDLQKNLAESLLRAVGVTVWLKQEADLDIVTALSGSGPAYFFYVMEAMQQAAIHLGLTVDTARLLTLQTALGAAKMAVESPVEVAQLRQQVTSPGGTTERAIEVLTQAQLPKILSEAIQAACTRSEELAQLLAQASE